MKKITTKMYIEFIKGALQEKGWKVTDIANKMALETEAITLDQYREAASIIADFYLNREEASV